MGVSGSISYDCVCTLHPEDRYFLGGITRFTWTDIHCLKWGTLPPLAKGRGCCIPPSVMKK